MPRSFLPIVLRALSWRWSNQRVWVGPFISAPASDLLPTESTITILPQIPVIKLLMSILALNSAMTLVPANPLPKAPAWAHPNINDMSPYEFAVRVPPLLREINELTQCRRSVSDSTRKGKILNLRRKKIFAGAITSRNGLLITSIPARPQSADQIYRWITTL